ncbi:MAG TPA: redoxin domain-containing protein [Acidimicrobiia bacterium]|nr:redoxin domain-containing protein [Acidimicrobiia bacterium]
MPAEIGSPAPDFSLRNVDGEMVSLDDLKGNKSLVVFIPFPFTGTCQAELCDIRDGLAGIEDLDARVVAITTDTMFANRKWSEDNSFGFPVLSDFWPHGEVTKAYGTFDDRVGAANRSTYVLDAEGVVRAIVATETRREAREFDEYVAALQRI